MRPLLDAWVPIYPAGTHPLQSRNSACIKVEASASNLVTAGRARPGGAPLLRLDKVNAFLSIHGDELILEGPSSARGTVDLSALVATVVVPEDVITAGHADTLSSLKADLFSMATISAALLLNRLGSALIHAGGVIDPSGRAWLLVGDARAGKSTTCATLISGGWRYTSDDNVVLHRHNDGSLVIEGWPRRFHLDSGWPRAEPIGVRETVDSFHQWAGKWQRSAPLGGLLFPRVCAGEPSRLEGISSADAVARVIRQCPWLLSDRRHAADTLALFSAACEKPCYDLKLGLDTFAKPDRLRHLLEAAIGAC